jgi:hypothetical protein
VLGELVRAYRGERDAVLVVLHFLGDADLHPGTPSAAPCDRRHEHGDGC